tara:strand:+ start:2246 stop:2791 length:546 start_codon:yes stop_codon:yes gene_type:complete
MIIFFFQKMKKSFLKAFCLFGIVFVSPYLSAQESEGFSWIKSIFNKDDSDQNEKPEVNFGEVSEGMKIAFEKIKSKRNESQIRDTKSFGKLVADDEQIKEIRESFRTAITDQAERFKQLIESLDGSTEDNKESLRENLKSLRTEWFESLKANREEFRLRIKEIRNEFENDREDILDSNEGD